MLHLRWNILEFFFFVQVALRWVGKDKPKSFWSIFLCLEKQMLSWEIEIRFMTPPLPFKERLFAALVML